jgi:hypothetical protein
MDIVGNAELGYAESRGTSGRLPVDGAGVAAPGTGLVFSRCIAATHYRSALECLDCADAGLMRNMQIKGGRFM